nr:hypothetical protein [Clostridiales bacterium]
DHRPVRPSSIPGMSVFETEKPSERKAERLSPIPDEKRAESPKFKRFADYSLIDRNMHVNNTHYVAWSEDACYSRIPRENSIRELTINYSSEVHPGEEVQLFCCKEDDVILVDGIEVISGRHVFTTRIVSSAE